MNPSAVDHQEPDLVGRVINRRYRIVEQIGRGGMGRIFRAEQLGLRRSVAIKVMVVGEERQRRDPNFHRRFLLEASACAKLRHPNTVSVYDYGRSEDGLYYFVMELLHGSSLFHTLGKEKRLSAQRAVRIAIQVCRALREAHPMGLVHRDLKPANIFLVADTGEGEFVKVLDFGLVKQLNAGDGADPLTRQGLLMGSPRYMAPEQIRNKDVDGRTDIYALGCVMYHVLTGDTPFGSKSGNDDVGTLLAHVNEAVPPMKDRAPDADIPARLEAIVTKCLEKAPVDRYSNVKELLSDLKNLATAQGWDLEGSTLAGSSWASETTGESALVPPPGSDFERDLRELEEYSSIDMDVVATPPLGQPFGPTNSQSFNGQSSEGHVNLTTGGQSPGNAKPPADPASVWSKNWVWVGLLVGALVLAVQQLSGGASESTSSVPEAQADTLDEPVSEGSERGAAGARGAPSEGVSDGAGVVVSLQSTPPGALASIGRYECVTPCELEILREEIGADGNAMFRFDIDGYHPLTVSRRLRSDQLRIEAAMVPFKGEQERE